MQGGELHDVWKTDGFNLRVQGGEAVARQLRDQALPLLQGLKPDVLFFYGPSLSTDEVRERMREMLLGIIDVERVSVEHDLLAAARSACQGEAGAVGILGTGSNACLYDGRDIAVSRGGLGYLLGDEGSGMDLGRRLLKACLDEQLPNGLIEEIEKYWRSDSKAVAREVYAAARPNVRLAALAPALNRFADRPEVSDIVIRALGEFVELSLMKLPLAEGQAVHFIGSIAVAFKPLLEKALTANGLKLGQVIERPIDQLIQYHLRHETERD